MNAGGRTDFLARFRPDGRVTGFAVLGGVFAEGVDLPGSLLIGAFIATLGLPPVSVTQDHIQARPDKLFGPGHGYADLVPAMQRVVQAAGRVLRTPEDLGWMWLLDDRYRRAEVIELLPPWWQLAGSTRVQEAQTRRSVADAAESRDELLDELPGAGQRQCDRLPPAGLAGHLQIVVPMHPLIDRPM